MNRRAFVTHTAALTASAWLLRPRLLAQNPSAPPAAPKAPSGSFTPLRRDVGLFTGRGGTIGWLASKDALVMVDTQFPDTAALCLNGLPGRGARQLDAVLNTHHHADHTSGNPTCKPATKSIVAHRNVPKLQMRAAERTNTLASQVFANELFDDVWRRELGGEIVTAQYFGPAHTSGDVVVTFEKANVVHLGDLVFNRIYPVIDRPAGASLAGWIKVLETVAKDYPSDALYIYGHGNAKFGVSGQRADLLVMRDYLAALLSHVQKEIAAGKSRDEIVRLDNLPGFPDWHVPPGRGNRLPGNLGDAYDELTAPKAS